MEFKYPYSIYLLGLLPEENETIIPHLLSLQECTDASQSETLDAAVRRLLYLNQATGIRALSDYYQARSSSLMDQMFTLTNQLKNKGPDALKFEQRIQQDRAKAAK